MKNKETKKNIFNDSKTVLNILYNTYINHQNHKTTKNCQI